MIIIEDKAKIYSSALKHQDDKLYWSESNMSENTVDVIPSLC